MPRGPGSPSRGCIISNGVSVRLEDMVGFSFPGPKWRCQTCHKRGPHLMLRICRPLYAKGQTSY